MSPTYSGRLLRVASLSLGLLTARLAWAQSQGDEPVLTIRPNAAGLQGVFAANGRQIMPYRYHHMYALGSGLLAVGDEEAWQFSVERWGVVDTTGRTVLPPAYGNVSLLGGRYLTAQQGQVNLLFDRRGRELRRFDARASFSVAARSNRLVAEREWQEQQGMRQSAELLDLADVGRVYLRNPCGSIYALSYTRGEQSRELPFFQAINCWGPGSVYSSRVLDANGQVRFDSVTSVQSAAGLLFLKTRRSVIVTDTLLRVVEPLSYRYFTAFITGPADRWVGVMDAENGRTGVLDRAGRVVLPIRYDGMWYTGQGTFALQNARTYHYSFLPANHQLVDLREYFFITQQDTLLGYGPIVLRHRVSNRHALLDPLDGHFLLPPRYEKLTRVTHEVVFFQGDSAGYLDFQGRLLRLETNFRYFSGYHEGRAVVARRVKVHRNSLPPPDPVEPGPVVEVLPPLFEPATPLPEPAPLPDSVEVFRYAYVDAHGRRVSPFFDWAGPFQNGYACVRRGREQYMINARFRPARFGKAHLLTYFRQGVAVVRDGQQYGLVDVRGRLVLPVRYQAIAMTGEYSVANGVMGPPGDDDATRWPMPLPSIQQGRLLVTQADGEETLLPFPTLAPSVQRDKHHRKKDTHQ